MVYGQQKHQAPVSFSRNRRQSDLQNQFRLKYTMYLTVAVAGAALLFFLPTLYFLSQNYHLFTSLAFDTHPALIQHLERESSWLTVFLFVSLAAISVVCFFLSLRMIKKIMNPSMQIERHLQGLIQGKWDQPQVQAEDNDFKDLAMTYNYFCRTLAINTEIELKMLEKLSIDPQNREAHSAWIQLIEMKRQRLGMSQNEKVQATDLDASSGAAVPLRRVS